MEHLFQKGCLCIGEVSQSSPGNLSARLYQFLTLLLKCIVHTLLTVSSWVEQLVDAVIFEVPVGFLKADYLFSSLLLQLKPNVLLTVPSITVSVL